VDELTRLAIAAADPGDTAAMAAFIRLSQPQVWSLCAYLVDEASADDLTQETYLRAFRALPSFRAESSARTWLLSIARRVCMDELRQRTRRRRQERRMLELGGQEWADTGATEQVEIRELLSHLSEDRRAAFVLTQILGLSYEETASACGTTSGTIASRVARARSDLIEALGASQDGDGPGPADGSDRRVAGRLRRAMLSRRAAAPEEAR
jgi:RNA polymerase sigma-70 factor (ECF subfamily)